MSLRKKITMKIEEKDTLQISYEDFSNVLKEWDEYIYLLLNEMPKKGFRVTFIDEGQGGDIFASHLEISDLSNLLWQSLKLGSEKVEEIHSSAFVEKQVDYFKRIFHSIENLTDTISSTENYYGWHNSDDPTESFLKLGKAAQLKIIQEGFLDTAISNYDKAKQIVAKREYKAEQERIKIRDEKRIIDKIKKKVRELDNLHCVFCDGEYRYGSFDYYQTDENKFEVDTVFSSCNSCLRKSKKENLEWKFGRFLNK